MKTIHNLMITGAINGFGKAMTFDRDKHLNNVVLVALSARELSILCKTVNKKDAPTCDKLPVTFRRMLILINKLVPVPVSEKIKYLKFAGCMQRDIYLS